MYKSTHRHLGNFPDREFHTVEDNSLKSNCCCLCRVANNQSERTTVDVSPSSTNGVWYSAYYGSRQVHHSGIMKKKPFLLSEYGDLNH